MVLLKKYYEQGGGVTGGGAFAAISNGHLDVVKFLLKNDTVIDASSIEHAVRSGKPNIVKYLLDNGVKSSTMACDEAASHGDMDSLKLLYSHWCTCSIHGFNSAALFKYEDVVVWLIYHNTPYTSSVLSSAVANSFNGLNMNIINKLIGYGLSVSSYAVETAVNDGHPQLAQMLRVVQKTQQDNRL